MLNRWRRIATQTARTASRILCKNRENASTKVNAKRRYRVLLIGHGLNSVPYLRDAREALEETKLGLQIRIYIQRFGATDNCVNQIAKGVGATSVGFFRTNIVQWDLVIFAKHPGGELVATHTINAAKKIYLSHGIETGKRINQDNYTYGHAIVKETERAFYNVMLAKSESEVKLARSLNPALAKMRFGIIGDVLLDRLLEISRQGPEQIRNSLKLNGSITTVLIASTWGASSLAFKMGREIIEEAKVLGGEYQFIVSVHQQVWTDQSSPARELCRWLRSIDSPYLRVLAPSEDWIPWLAASDVAVTDHTSLGLYFAHLRRPMIHFAANENDLIPEWPAHRLRMMAPRIQAPRDLAGLLMQARKNYEYQELDRINVDTVAYPGQGRERLRNLLYTLLQE